MKTAITPIRRLLQTGDGEAIAALHRRVYGPEFGMNENFVAGVAGGVRAALARGWPGQREAVWLVERENALAGSLALTDEGDGTGRVRWFVLERELRGCGLGAQLLAELLDVAKESEYRKLELETLSALSVAARMYRAAGFRPVSEVERTDWGPPVRYQRYQRGPLTAPA